MGEQLRDAREAKGITLEDIAAQTRIPTRHLESIEKSEWDNLPAPTYTIGFRQKLCHRGRPRPQRNLRPVA